MRRTLPVLLTATLLFAACSSSGDSTSDGSTVDSVATTDSAGSTDPSVPTDSTASTTPATNPDKPTVEIPAEIPTALDVTVIDEGTGPEAKAGDTVIVDYVGVRSSDGVEFDNSYDRFEPFPVVLGQGSVIKGWDEGLTGAKAGSKIRLDIPSDLAYGAEARGDIIGANEALTFVVEVRAVISPPDPANAPTDAGVPASTGAKDTTTVDLVEGTGPAMQAGQTGVVNYVVFRGDNLVQLESSWAAEPVQIGTAAATGFPGFVKGLPGMKVGGRRAIIIPPADSFGPDGNPQLGLPANTDMIVVVDLLGIYGKPTG